MPGNASMRNKREGSRSDLHNHRTERSRKDDIRKGEFPKRTHRDRGGHYTLQQMFEWNINCKEIFNFVSTMGQQSATQGIIKLVR